MNESSRRTFLLLSTSAALAACQRSADSVTSAMPSASASAGAAPSSSAGDKHGDEEEVGAVEDLMREHGVLRRALIVYRESATKLRTNAAQVPPGALQRTAKLFRAFGEEYHEKKLEEQFIFPAVKKAGGQAGTLVDTLKAQHDRGREITDWIIAKTATAKIDARAEDFAKLLDQFSRMYEAHAALEDTIVFPAWKKTMNEKQLDEMGEKFEDIEKAQFGSDGFEDAVKQIGAIEAELGIADLALFTAPPPPKA